MRAIVVRVCVLAAASLALFTTPAAYAQSFNLDIGYGGGTPSVAYGAAAGQTGFWHNVDVFSPSSPQNLVDVHGNTSSAKLHGHSPLNLYANDANTSGDDAALLDDLAAGPANWQIHGLAAGDYEVFTYAWASDNPTSYITLVTVAGSPDGQQGVGGMSWSGVHVLGGTYAKHRVCGLPAGGAITITFAIGAGYSSCNGIQLVHRAPAAVACTPAGPTSGGCLPTISASSNPKVAHSNPCSITVQGLDGQRAGLVYYGVQGAQQVSWCGGGNSFLCVKAPQQRTPVQNSSGSAGQCDGSLVLDWNAYQLSHTGALGNPWSVCDRAWVQAWFRDPGSCNSTFLSPMLELTYAP